MLEILAGRPPNLGASVKDCNIHVDEMRMLRLGDEDDNAIQHMFKRLQQMIKTFLFVRYC